MGVPGEFWLCPGTTASFPPPSSSLRLPVDVLECGIMSWRQAGRALGFGNEEEEEKYTIKKGRKINDQSRAGKESLSCPKVVLNSVCRCLGPQVGCGAAGDTVPCPGSTGESLVWAPAERGKGRRGSGLCSKAVSPQ